VISRPVFGRVLAWVARSRSSDLFLLAVLLLALGTAYAADVAGLAAPIGAFLAGVVIAESDFRHQIQDDIRPFRDVLVGLFFVTVGMELAPASAAGSPWAVLAWIMVFVPGKAAVALLSGVLLRWPLQTAVRVAIILSHGGEFGLLLLTQAIASGVIAPALGQPALLALAITMGLAPLLIQSNGRIARLVLSGFWRPAAEREEGGADPESGNGRGHVLVCGYGRIGRLVVTVLEAANVPCVTLEADLERFRQAKEQGCRVVFGDASRSTVLEAAGLPRATLIVVTFDHRPAVERLLHHARDAHPGLPSLLSTGDDTDVAALSQAGVTAVFPENLAAGLALADQALVLSGLSQERAARVITEVRAQLNPELQGRVGI
jgi:CPA2 family monovalent cation:H+ antiporter-2